MGEDWLNYEAKRTGKTTEEIRAIMRERNQKVKAANRPFAKDPKAASRAAQVRWAKHRKKLIGGDAEG